MTERRFREFTTRESSHSLSFVPTLGPPGSVCTLANAGLFWPLDSGYSKEIAEGALRKCPGGPHESAQVCTAYRGPDVFRPFGLDLGLGS
jgi:hypothetical protein